MIWFDTDEFKEKAKRLITIIENTNLEQAFVLHHTDNDGFGSAAVIHHFLPNIPLRNYIPCNYGDNTDLLDEKVAAAGIANTHVFFCVDYTPDEELIREYSEQGYIWVFMDHHQTAIEKLANLNFNGLDFCKSQMDDAEKIIPEDYQQGKLVRQFSATELIYHIFIRLELPGLNVVRYKGMIPEVISCIGRYDVWDLNANPKIKLFKAATCNLDVNDWFKDIVHIPETLNLPSLQKIEAYSKLLSIKYKNVFDNLIEMGK